MTIKGSLINLGKLLLCSLVFAVGMMIGGIAVSLVGLQPPPMPEGVDGNRAFLILLLESPLLALALVLLARGLGGRLLPRAAALSSFTWVVYSLNTAIETLAFTATTVEGALSSAVSCLLPSILCGTAAAWLYPSRENGTNLAVLARAFFGARTVGAWVWRIALAAVVFVPIYLLFGSLVAPLTAQYFQESLYGLRQPSQEEMLLVLLLRSILFLLACLPIIVMWRRSRWGLFPKLGFALFMLVGFLYMLGAYYMPLAVRVPHSLEILADSFAHAGLLVMLLARSDPQIMRTAEVSAV
jgi:hypothetical protein